MNINNLKVRRLFLVWLKQAAGLGESTIVGIARSIEKFDQLLLHKDYRSIKSVDIILFKEKLQRPDSSGTVFSMNSVRTHLLNLKRFMQWLASQKGYKNNINHNLIQYFNLSNHDKMITGISGQTKEYPKLEYVKKLCASIKIGTVIDRRDQAIIAFTFLTGMRVKAIATLPLGCVNFETGKIEQNPKLGVATKFSKQITSYIFNLDPELYQIVMKWIEYLWTKNFHADHPLFPMSKSVISDSSFNCPTEITSEFWKTSQSIRNIFYSRMREAGLKVYNPHSFRHGFITHVRPYLTDSKLQKAFSQSIGHENISTTLIQYGNLPQDDLIDTLSKINFKSKPISNEEVINELKYFLSQKDIKIG